MKRNNNHKLNIHDLDGSRPIEIAIGIYVNEDGQFEVKCPVHHCLLIHEGNGHDCTGRGCHTYLCPLLRCGESIDIWFAEDNF